MHKALAALLASLAANRLRLRLIAACFTALVMLASPVEGVAQTSSESALKAAFLYKFTSFVEWPAGTFKRDDPLQIGVMGDDGVYGELEQLVAGRSFEGRPIAVRRLREGDDPGGLHVLFVGAGRDARLREVVASTAGPVLLVSEQENGLRLGAVLNFDPDPRRVRFSASIAAAEARGLRLSARLLAIAENVEGRAR
ncbi:MAG: YfiR family protein [Ramlibacter sp.]